MNWLWTYYTNNGFEFVGVGSILISQAPTHAFARDRLRHVSNPETLAETLSKYPIIRL